MHPLAERYASVVSYFALMGSGVVMRCSGFVLLVCLVLAGCSSSGSANREVVFEVPEGSRVSSVLAGSDEDSVWWQVRSVNSNGPVSLVKADAVSGEVLWTTEAGYGGRAGPFFDGERVWRLVDSVGEVDDDPETAVWVEIDAGSGEVLQTSEFEFRRGALIDGVLWSASYSNIVSLYDIDTLELTGEVDFNESVGPDGLRPNMVDGFVELDGVVWVTDDLYMVGYDQESLELVDVFEVSEYGFNDFEVHDGLIWANGGELGVASFEPSTGAVEEFERYDSPHDSIERDGFSFERLRDATIAQVDTESGETVATFENIVAAEFTVAGGYLWWEAADTKIMRVENADTATG